MYSCFEKYQLDYAMLVDADDNFVFLNEWALEKLSNEVNSSSSKNLLPGLITYGI